MTDYERRQLAAQSLESNVHDENFCELFPELTMVKFAKCHQAHFTVSRVKVYII